MSKVKCRLCDYTTPKMVKGKKGKVKPVWAKNLEEHYFSKHREEYLQVLGEQGKYEISLDAIEYLVDLDTGHKIKRPAAILSALTSGLEYTVVFIHDKKTCAELLSYVKIGWPGENGL